MKRCHRFASAGPFGMLRSMSPTAASLRHAAAAALFSSSLLVGCAYGEMPQVLRAQVASEAGCPEIVVQQAPSYMGMSESQYNVRGCGIERLYTCNNPSGGMVKFGSADCSFVAAGTPKAAGGEAAPPADPGAADPDADPSLDADTSG